MSAEFSPDLLIIGNDIASVAISQTAMANNLSVLSVCWPNRALALPGGYFADAWSGACSWFETSFTTVSTNRQSIVLSIAGALISPAVRLRSLLDLQELKHRTIGVVAVSVGAEWNATFIVKTLHKLGFLGAQVVDISAQVPATNSLLEFARWVDREASVDILAGALLSNQARFDAYLFAPVLGLLTLDVADRLSSRLQTPVGECAGPPSSPPAYRLATVFEQWRAPIAPTSGPIKIVLEPKLTVSDGMSRWTPRSVVVATGNITEGGVEFDRAFTEPMCNAPIFEALPGGDTAIVTASASRGVDPVPWFSPAFDGAIRAGNIGVMTDSDGRILGSDKRTPLHRDLLAVGTVACARRDCFRPTDGEEFATALMLGARLVQRLQASTSDR
jgi:hypothetical protein